MAKSSLEQLQKLKQNKTYSVMMIFLVLIAIIWVGFSITLSNTKEQVDPKIIALTKPFSPVLDKKVFDLIEKKRHYADDKLRDFPIYKLIFNKDSHSEVLVPIEFDETLLTPTPQATPTPTIIIHEVTSSPTP